MELQIPYYSLEHQHNAIRSEVEQAFSALIDKGQFILGSQTQQFEEELAAFLGVARTTGVGNGSDALYTSLIVMGVGRGDEVIVPAHTCAATWVAVSRTGATLVPVDAHPELWLMTADAIDAAITGKTRAVIPVHLYGFPCNMPAIMEVATARKLIVVEDNAQGLGASFNNKKTGAWGACNALSFYPTKNLGSMGDGGAVVTDNERAWQNASSFRNYGTVRTGAVEVPGINSRLDELQAAILRIKLRQLKTWNNQRREIAGWYRSQLDGLDSLQLPRVVQGGEPAYHIFPIAVSNRDKLREYLESKGIGTSVHYPVTPLRQDAYKNAGIKGTFAVADRLAQTQISLPIWPGLKQEEVIAVCDLIKKFLSRPVSKQ